MREAHSKVDFVCKCAGECNTEDFHCKDVYRHFSVIRIWKIWATKMHEVLRFNANFIRKENSIMSRAVYKYHPSTVMIKTW